MAKCKLVDILPEQDLPYLLQTIEQALEEAHEVWRAQQDEPPPLFDLKSLSDAMQDYADLIQTQRERIYALEHFRDALQREVK